MCEELIAKLVFTHIILTQNHHEKKIGGIGLCMLAWSILTCAQTITPQAEQRAKDIVSKMTLQEKIEYISGYTSFFSACHSPFGNT